MQKLLEDEARVLGKESGFVQRQSKMSAPKFVETLVLGLLERPEASLNEWAAISAELGVAISEPGLQERINSKAVCLLAGLLKKMRERLQNPVPLPGEVLRRFSAIYVLESSIVTLPKSMRETFTGFASPGSESAVKFQWGYEYLRGNLAALEMKRVAQRTRVVHWLPVWPRRAACI